MTTIQNFFSLFFRSVAFTFHSVLFTLYFVLLSISLASKWLLSKLWASRSSFAIAKTPAGDPEENLHCRILPKLCQLHELKLSHVDKRNEDVLEEAIKRSASTLRRVAFDDHGTATGESNVVEFILDGVTFPRLRELHGNNLHFSTFQTFIQRAKNLREITIPNDIYASELVYLCHLLAGATPELEIINLTGTSRRWKLSRAHSWIEHDFLMSQAIR